MMGFIKFWIGLACLIIISGCGKPLVNSDLVGVYNADEATAKEQLTILSDGRFDQQVTLKSNSQIFRSSGVWTFDPTDGHILFKNGFLSLIDGFGRPYSKIVPSNASMPVARIWGNVQIGEAPSVEYKR